MIETLIALACLALVAWALHVMRGMARDFALGVERLATLQQVGTPGLLAATVTPPAPDAESRAIHAVSMAEQQQRDAEIERGVTSLRALYRTSSVQVPPDADLRAEVELMLNGEVPSAW